MTVLARAQAVRRISPPVAFIRLVAGASLGLSACAAPTAGAPPPVPARLVGLEVIHILRSIREPVGDANGRCDPQRTGFTPFPSDGARDFSFWSVQSDPADGRVTDAARNKVGELRACFGPTDNPARQNFYADGTLGGMPFRGVGECLALSTDVPEPGLYSVRCHLILDRLPTGFVGGLLTTNTLTSRAAFGPQTDPPGYTQASIATLRFWRARTGVVVAP